MVTFRKKRTINKQKRMILNRSNELEKKMLKNYRFFTERAILLNDQIFTGKSFGDFLNFSLRVL